MDCATFEVLLADYLDEALAPARSAEFLNHMATCASCAEMAADARSAMAFMSRAADVEPPPALLTRILHETNSGWELKLRGRGVRGWINRTFAPVLQPRIVMGAMLTVISATMLTQCAGVQNIEASQLDPVHLWVSLDERVHRIWDRTVKSYESMRLVYEVRSQLDDWSRQQREEQDAAADARANSRKLEPKEIRKDGLNQ